MRGQRAKTTAEPGVCVPTSFGSGQEEPPSAMSPRRAKAEAMLTPEAAKRMSQWSAMAKPIPAQAPLIAAITCAAGKRVSQRRGRGDSGTEGTHGLGDLHRGHEGVDVLRGRRGPAGAVAAERLVAAGAHVGEPAHVDARAEAAAGAGEHDDADVGVGIGAGKGGPERGEHAAGQRVHLLRACAHVTEQ